MTSISTNYLEQLSALVRRHIVEATTAAKSGHPTSSLSAVELMVSLMFGGAFRYRVNEPDYPNNDRLIFSKGHAAPLLYALWAVAGEVTQEELLTLRQFDSELEGHPTGRFKHAEVVTGSLGQGLSVGVGMALAAKMDSLPYLTYVLLGDSEMAEGQVWEAVQLAAYYKLNNLVGIIDVNRLGQRGETMLGWDYKTYAARVEAFGWNAVMLDDGHHLPSVLKAYQIAATAKTKPTMIIAKTVKGKGVSFLENQAGWHGKVLSTEECEKALAEIGETDGHIKGSIKEPEEVTPKKRLKTTKQEERKEIWVQLSEEMEDKKPVATRKAYGQALVALAEEFQDLVVLDAEVSNSTFTETFKQQYPERFWEMFIAEQNMVSVAVGMASCGKKPFVSTFAAFLSRAVDQIRMAQYAEVGINLVGSHAGVSIGQDGASQMGLEDIAIFRAILESVVVYPADQVATMKLVERMVEQASICYMRTTRMNTPPIYGIEEEFVIGGSKTLRQSEADQVTLIGAGITLHECLKAYEQLKEKGMVVRVIDLYSIKPIDVETLVKACKETRALVVVEDHYPEGGMAEAVRSALIYETTPVHSLAVRKMPRSGKPEELLAYEEIDAAAIVRKVEEIG